MDGLTYWCDNGHGGGKWFVAIDAEGGEDYGPHVDRLAAYEETGLEPGEIEQLKGEVFGLKVDKQELEQYRALGPIDHLRELKLAAYEGRCVVLPCKIGDAIFMPVGRWNTITGYEPDVCDGFHIASDGILQIKAKCWTGNHGTYGVPGKTVFLTRDAAESALRREQDG